MDNAKLRGIFEAGWPGRNERAQHDPERYAHPVVDIEWNGFLACARALEPIDEARRVERGKLLDEITHICRLFLDDADGKYNATSCFIAILGKTVDGHKQMKNDAAMSAALEDGNATE